MSQENIEVVHAAYAAWNDHDLNALLEVTHPGVEIRTSGAFPDLDPIYPGHNGVRSSWDAVLAPWDSFHVDVERIVEGDACVAIAARLRVQGEASGVPTDQPQGHVASFEDGRIVSMALHTSFDEALETAGLSN